MIHTGGTCDAKIDIIAHYLYIYKNELCIWHTLSKYLVQNAKITQVKDYQIRIKSTEKRVFIIVIYP